MKYAPCYRNVKSKIEALGFQLNEADYYRNELSFSHYSTKKCFLISRNLLTKDAEIDGKVKRLIGEFIRLIEEC